MSRVTPQFLAMKMAQSAPLFLWRGQFPQPARLVPGSMAKVLGHSALGEEEGGLEVSMEESLMCTARVKLGIVTIVIF